MSVNVFPAPTSLIRKICKGFYVCFFSFYKISSTIFFVHDLIFSYLKKIVHMIYTYLLVQMNYKSVFQCFS